MIHCTGKPVGVLRTSKPVANFELVAEWKHLESGGNSGIFVWAPEKALDGLKPNTLRAAASRSRCSTTATRPSTRSRSGKKATWFTTDGDVFAVGTSKMKPVPARLARRQPQLPHEEKEQGGRRVEPLLRPRINGEVRLWVNGEEVSGGSDCEPRSGYLCLESEGAPGRVPEPANPRAAVDHRDIGNAIARSQIAVCRGDHPMSMPSDDGPYAGRSAIRSQGAADATRRLPPMPDHDLALNLVRTTEAAALGAARWVGRGDKIAADQAAVDAMRLFFNAVHDGRRGRHRRGGEGQGADAL